MDNVRATGMAIAVASGNTVTLLFTLVFARLLGASGYASLATLTSAFFIVSVPGTAVQALIAREVSAAAAGRNGDLLPAVYVWTRMATAASVALAALSVLLRAPLAHALGVDQQWAAALVLPSGGLWMLVSLQRGILQGLGRYRLVGTSLVGEALTRLVLGLVLVEAGLGVAGAFGGLPAALCVLAVVLGRSATGRRHALGMPLSASAAPALLAPLRRAGSPVLAMGLLAALQNLDVIVVKHALPARLAGIYAAAAFSAKGLVWIAVGLGMYLLPETSRRLHQGNDTRRLLLITLALVAGIALPTLAAFALIGRGLLGILFGSGFQEGAHALTLLGIAMTGLAVTFLTVQYLIALQRNRFLWLLALAAIAEPAVLASYSDALTEVATALLAVQLPLAVALLILAWRSDYSGPLTTAHPGRARCGA